MPRRSNPSSTRSTTIGRPPPTKETATTTMSGTYAPDALVQREGPRRTETSPETTRGGSTKPIQAHRAQIGPACPHRRHWLPSPDSQPPPSVAAPADAAGADAAAAARTPVEGGRRHRRALGLCPVTPLAVVAEERSTRGRSEEASGAAPWRDAVPPRAGQGGLGRGGMSLIAQFNRFSNGCLV
jgi:hypothetical protein